MELEQGKKAGLENEPWLGRWMEMNHFPISVCAYLCLYLAVLGGWISKGHREPSQSFREEMNVNEKESI